MPLLWYCKKLQKRLTLYAEHINPFQIVFISYCLLENTFFKHNYLKYPDTPVIYEFIEK